MRRTVPALRIPGLLVALVLAGLMTAPLTGTLAAAPRPLELIIGDIYPDSAMVRLDFTVPEPLPADSTLREELPPAAYACTIETWRDRSGWFDQLVSSRTFGYRIERDQVRELFRVTAPDGAVVEIIDRADLGRLLGRQTGVIGARLQDLEPGRRHYFVITARLIPIDLTRLADMEAWLNGEIRTGGGGGGVLTIPKAAVGFLAGLAGLGETATSARSRSFRRPADGAAPVTIER